ncbi:hypothetical protein ACSSUQ_004248 [Yersinia enterocolitica]
MSRNKKRNRDNRINKNTESCIVINEEEFLIEEVLKFGYKTYMVIILLLVIIIPIIAQLSSKIKFDNTIVYPVVNENNYDDILKSQKDYLPLDFDNEPYALVMKKSNNEFIDLSLESQRIELNWYECSRKDNPCRDKIKSDKLILTKKIQDWSNNRVDLGAIWVKQNKNKDKYFKYDVIRIAIGNRRIFVNPYEYWKDVFNKICSKE